MEAKWERERGITAVAKAGGNKTHEADWFMLRGSRRYYQGDVASALEFARAADEPVSFFAGHLTRAEHVSFYSLIIVASYDGAAPAEKPALDALLRRNRAQLANWADHCAANFLAMRLLVEAEQGADRRRAGGGDGPLRECDQRGA
jgi:hypothetical protein